jgi:ABC-type branched-subunit amino acid transport system ATPase component
MSVREGEDPESRENLPGEDAEQNGVVLEITDLHAGYGEVPVLHGMSLALHEGEAIGIVGHNGMGKTTLLKTIMGLLPSRGGKIVIDGVDVTSWAAHERSRLGVAYVPQGRGILAGLSAQENLRLAWTPDSGETEERAIERVVGIFPRLSRLLDRRGGALSGGEQQILALARALVPLPWLLLLDEPSEGIQPSIIEEIGALLATLRDKHRLSMLIVEQNLELVLDVANRIVLVERGRITRELSTAAVRGGAIADLVGLGAARTMPAAPGAVAQPAANHVAIARERARAGAIERSASFRPLAERQGRIAVAEFVDSRAGRCHQITRGSHVDRQTANIRANARYRQFAAFQHVGGRNRRIFGSAGRHFPILRPGQSTAGLSPAGSLSAHAGLPAGRQREPAQRLGGEDGSTWRRPWTAVRQARRPQGQHLPRGRADDERRLDA